MKLFLKILQNSSANTSSSTDEESAFRFSKEGQIRETKSDVSII